MIKTVAFLALIAACFLITPHVSAPAPAPPPFPTGLKLATALLLAMQGVVFTYDSYYYVIYSSEELEDPGHIIPRSIFGSISMIAAIYILLNVAFLHVLPIGAMAGDKFVGGSATRALFGPAGDVVIRVIVILSVLGTINAYMLAAPRVLLSMGRDGLFTGWATRVNRGGTPSVGLLLGTIASVTFLLSGTFERTLALGTFFIVFNYALAFAAYFGLRKKEPGLPRPYSAKGHPWTGALALAGALLFLGAAVFTDTRNSLIAIAIIALSWPVFLLVRRPRTATP